MTAPSVSPVVVAEPNVAVTTIDLARLEHVVREPRGCAEQDRQHAGRERIETARVPCLRGAEQPFRALQRAVRGDARRFVEQQQPEQVAGWDAVLPVTGRKNQSAPGPVPRASSMRRPSSTARRALVSWRKRSSGTRRSCSARATRERKKPRACSKPSLIGPGSSSRPSVLKWIGREAQVTRDFDVADARIREPRVLDLCEQQLVQQALDLGGDCGVFWRTRAALAPLIRLLCGRSRCARSTRSGRRP